jgi:SSS family solute:Na+ symporter
MESLDLIIILFYFTITLSVGLYYAQNKLDTTENYFLAGRNLGWMAIGVSLFATNISSEHFVGLAGYGASRGLAVGNIEWLAIPFLMLLGWFFAPIFLRAKIFTVPEFFGKRFNTASRMYLSSVSIVAYILTKISVSLFAGGLLLKAVLGWDMYTSAVVMVVITGVYTIIGGMSAVVYTSVIQAIFLIGGAVVLTGFGLTEVGGLSGLQAKLPADSFSIFKPVSDPDFPWTGIVFGAPILAIWYWCTDQYIVQRILSAKDVNAARGGTLLTGFMKILPMFILVLPGLIATVLYPGIKGDEAYSALLTGSLLPAGLKGFVLAGVLAALMSSLSACFISTSTLFTMDFYRHFRPNAPEKKLVLVGHLATTAMVVIGILWIPLVKLLNSHIYIHLQSIQAYISPPIAAVFLLGVFWKRVNGKGAIWALTVGGFLGALRLALEWLNQSLFFEFPFLSWFISMNFLHFAFLMFVISSVIMAVVSVLSTAPYSPKIKEYLFSWSEYSFAAKRAEFFGSGLHQKNRFSQLFSVTLLVVLIGLWGIFF